MIKFIKTRKGYRCNRWKMARRRGRFRRRSSSPLPTGSFDHGCRVWKRSARTSVHVLSVAHGHARSSLKRSVPIEDGGDSFLSRKIFFAKLWQRFVKVACDFLLERSQTFDVQTNRIDCCSGISSFFPLSLFFPPSSSSFFVYNHLARRSRISRITRKRIIPRTKRGKRNRRNDFSLWARTKRFPFPVSLCLSLYIRIYRRGVNPTNYRPFSNQRLRSSFVKSVNREISLSS